MAGIPAVKNLRGRFGDVRGQDRDLDWDAVLVGDSRGAASEKVR